MATFRWLGNRTFTCNIYCGGWTVFMFLLFERSRKWLKKMILLLLGIAIVDCLTNTHRRGAASFGMIRLCANWTFTGTLRFGSHCAMPHRCEYLDTGEQEKQLTCNLNKSSWQLTTHFSSNVAFMLSMRFIRPGNSGFGNLFYFILYYFSFIPCLHMLHSQR